MSGSASCEGCQSRVEFGGFPGGPVAETPCC